MEERNNNLTAIINESKTKFFALGLFSIIAVITAYFWIGDTSSFIFLLVSAAIFFYAIFYPRSGFFILLAFRTTFDYLGGQELLKVFGVSINFTFLLGMMLIALALLELFKQRHKFKSIPLLIPWVSFLGIIAILSFFSFSKQASAVDFFRLLSFFSAFIYGYLVFDTPKRLTDLAKAIMLTGIIPASVAWWQLFNRTGFF